MNIDKQRIAIAETLGIRVNFWFFQWLSGDKKTWVDSPPYKTEDTAREEMDDTKNYGPVRWIGEVKCVIDAPDYLNNLDDICGAVESLRNNQFHYVRYPRELFEVVSKRKWTGDMGYFLFNLVNATAGQQCEAYLKTLDLWTEDK